MPSIENIRLTLLISLVILLVAVLWRRFKRKVMAEDLPAPQHAELLGLQVAYHPARLRVEVSMPSPQELRAALVTREHEPVHGWPSVKVLHGVHVLEFALPELVDGEHYFEISTPTQRTVRVFRLHQR